MIEFAARMLHTDVSKQPFGSEDALPLYLRGLFDFEKWTAFGVDFIAATPKENLAVKTLAKHAAKLHSTTELPVAFAYEGTTGYRAERMVEAGIPFIVNDRQIYLPFLGVALAKEHGRNPIPQEADVDKVSAQTQRFVPKAIYEGLANLSVTQASELLGVSKITASRIFDELEAIDPTWVTAIGRIRRFDFGAERAALWRMMEPHLFNPVVREYRLERISAPGYGRSLPHTFLLSDKRCRFGKPQRLLSRLPARRMVSKERFCAYRAGAYNYVISVISSL